jgi:hypothetical protein
MAITTILAEYPFSSIRDVSRLTHISKLWGIFRNILNIRNIPGNSGQGP